MITHDPLKPKGRDHDPQALWPADGVGMSLTSCVILSMDQAPGASSCPVRLAKLSLVYKAQETADKLVTLNMGAWIGRV